MPYSITTRDGITINDIPDDMPDDAPQLKERVARIRGQASPAAVPASVSAPKSGYLMGLRDPIDALAQVAENVVPDGVATKVNQFNNWLADQGLPVARVEETPHGTTKLVQQVNQVYDQQRKQGAQGLSNLVTGEQKEPGFDWGRLAGNIVNPTTILLSPGAAGAKTVGQMAVAGAKAGAVGGLLTPETTQGSEDNFWGRKAGQVAMGAGMGAAAAPVVGKAIKGAGRAVGAVRRASAARSVSPQQIQIASVNAATAHGYDWGQMPAAMRESVQAQVEQSLRSGARLDPAAIMRQAEAQAVGLTGDAALTTGQATRNPMQFTQERNMRGVEISTPQGRGNPLMERFANQNEALTNRFNDLGAGQATEPGLAGQTLMDALRAYDRPVKAAVDGAYENARSMTQGRAVELNRGAFSQAANEALDQGMWGRFVPPEVRGMLNDITEGKAPFTVESEVQIDGILAAAQRKAGRGTPEWSAIGQIRTALQSTPFADAAPAGPAAQATQGAATRAAGDVVDNGVTDAAFREVSPTALPGQRALPAPPGQAVATEADFTVPGQSFSVGPARAPGAGPEDVGAAAREAFRQARGAARARFATIEDTPALGAALEGDAPDNFVRRHVLGANARDLANLRQILDTDPQAMQQARAQVAEHLRRAAFGENPTGDKAFRVDRYMETLRSLGGQRLGAFFTPAEIQQLNLIGRTASTINTQPAGSAVNNSNTGSALMTMLSKVAESPLMRKVPGARALSNQVGEIQTEAQIRQALSGRAPQQPAELSPEQVRALGRALSFGGVTAGMAGGSAGQ